ncbi:L-idonate 5-dehydrogenase [Neorhizobium galegae]|uniref:L-idonate 5-dehydrogenase n=1 Tax=Neorhizobium galegae TaxID=399 RepID=UPI00278372AD|nr:L-idonate 5-dehydrogenase [Neorhizobium galegae]MDQ0137696.1 L-idonate 5-dehydrogenase [Neorhizobium galegae]
MRSLIIHNAKDLRIEDGPVPEPAAGQVLVQIERGGICGSDLHYFNHGGFGTVRLKEPMVLGHEVSGRIVKLGGGVSSLAVGDLVAVSPSRPCGHCRYCQEGKQNHCLNMRFYGSAMPFPHIQGAFREQLVADEAQCVKANGLSAGEAAVAEPLAVCLHGVRQAGEILGKKVLVTGSGPIGVLCVLAARRAGAGEIVVTDITDQTLAHASRAGADRTINTATGQEAMIGYGADKGYFDIHFECSGAPAALATGIAALRPKGVIVQLGMGGDMTVPVQAITAKELSLKGSFRFHEEFETAVRLMQGGLIDVKPLITHTLPIEQTVAAFDLASDRQKSMKVQIALTP